MIPKAIAEGVCTNPAAGVMATKPITAPQAAPTGWTLFLTIKSNTAQVTNPVEAAV